MGGCVWKGCEYFIYSFRFMEFLLWIRWVVWFIDIVFLYYGEFYVVLDKKMRILVFVNENKIKIVIFVLFVWLM